MGNELIVSDFIEGIIPNDFYHISFWRDINDGYYEENGFLVYRYRYSNYKLEACFITKTKKVYYLMLEPLGDGNLEGFKIIDDINIFGDKIKKIANRKTNKFKIEFFYDDELSIYLFPLEV